MSEVAEQLGQKYPQVAENLGELPPHVVEHVGALALDLSHEDMYGKKEVGSSWEKTLVADFEHVITDPADDSQELEAEAIEAAHRGEEKLASILHTGSRFLKEAHASLRESGYSFGAKAAETDEQSAERELKERDDIYEAAAELAIKDAEKAKQGDHEASVTDLESLLVLRHLHSRASSYFDPDRRQLREAVRSGLSGELLEAAQTSFKLFTGKNYLTVGSSVTGMKALLSVAVGKSLDKDFQPTDAKLDGYSFQIGSMEDIKDVVAASTAPDAPFSLDQGLRLLPSSTVAIQLLKSREGHPDNPVLSSPEQVYQMIELATDHGEVIEALKTDNPLAVLDAAAKLGLGAFRAASLTARVQDGDYNALRVVDTEAIKELEELKQAYPQYFGIFIEASHDRDQDNVTPVSEKGYSPRAVIKGIAELEKLGVTGDAYIAGLAKVEEGDFEEYAVTCKELADMITKLSDGKVEIDEALALSGTNLPAVIRKIVKGGEPVYETVGDLFIHASLTKSYLVAYKTIKYPVYSFNDTLPEITLDSQPQLKERLKLLGISEELAAEIFKSWGTHSEFIKHHYKGDSFTRPTEPLEESTLKGLAEGQAKALEEQLKAIEDFEKSYGQEALHKVIENFGIYNFNYFNSEALYQQLKRWEAGEPIDSVVIRARSDWNSYTGKAAVFPAELGDGVVYFEANSGAGVARVAIMVGRHERANGRNPDINRFIINGHGSADGIAMGVNGERIDMAAYREAARDAKKIGAQEINTYARHLGPNFELILQSCSNAKGDINIAKTMHERHEARVVASDVTVEGIRISKDGSIRFITDDGRDPIVYPRER